MERTLTLIFTVTHLNPHPDPNPDLGWNRRLPTTTTSRFMRRSGASPPGAWEGAAAVAAAAVAAAAEAAAAGAAAAGAAAAGAGAGGCAIMSSVWLIGV